MRWFIPFLFLPLPAMATEVDLELVLLADAAGSIDAEEIAVQRQGYAEAITHPDMLRTIGNTLTGSIAGTCVEWAALQQVVDVKTPPHTIGPIARLARGIPGSADL